MADPAAGRERVNRAAFENQLDSIASSIGILETTLMQYDEDMASRIGNEILNQLTILKFRFDRFAFRLKNLLPAQPISLNFEDVMLREVHSLIRRVSVIEASIDNPPRVVRQRRQR